MLIIIILMIRKIYVLKKLIIILIFELILKGELWVVLLEKAWMKLNGNYAKAIGDEPHEVFDAITNAYSEII